MPKKKIENKMKMKLEKLHFKEIWSTIVADLFDGRCDGMFKKPLATLERSKTTLNEVVIYPAECLKTIGSHITNALTIF